MSTGELCPSAGDASTPARLPVHTGDTSMIDLTPLVQALAALALAALSGATPYLAPMLRRYLHVQISATQATAIQSAADAGAQAAYGYIVANASNYRDVTVRNAALATGVQHVIASVPQAMTALNV